MVSARRRSPRRYQGHGGLRLWISRHRSSRWRSDPNIENVSAGAPRQVLTLHVTAPDHPIAWLNLGFALRRMALLDPSDPPAVNARRLDHALHCFQRSLDQEAQNVRVWTGCAFVFYQRGDHDREVECYPSALAIDPSDPGLWLFYCDALEAAARHEEALATPFVVTLLTTKWTLSRPLLPT